jgi:ABC-2 type transport system ATP-binding protein
MNFIEVQDLTKIYRLPVKEHGLRGAFKALVHQQYLEKTAINHINISLAAGEALACIGENGSGKSTLIKMLVGILTPTTGSVRALGGNPADHKESYLRQIGVIFGQKTNLWWDIPVIESFRAIRSLYKLSPSPFEDTLKMVTELLDLKDILNIPARRLSLGQRMRADIAMVLLHRPKILFLDEPTIGLDINVKYKIRAFLRKINQDEGVSILLTSHDLDDIVQVCDNALILSEGRIIYRGSLSRLQEMYVRRKVVKITGELRDDIRRFLPGVEVDTQGRITSIHYDYDAIPSSVLLEVINTCFDISDLTIQGPDIEEIVARIFSGKETVV